MQTKLKTPVVGRGSARKRRRRGGCLRGFELRVTLSKLQTNEDEDASGLRVKETMATNVARIAGEVEVKPDERRRVTDGRRRRQKETASTDGRGGLDDEQTSAKQ
jgi:hypothetical protein